MTRLKRTDHNLTYEYHPGGNRLVHDEEVEVDITEDAVEYDLHDKLRKHLAKPSKNLADVDRKLAALIRLVIAHGGARDLLDDNNDT